MNDNELLKLLPPVLRARDLHLYLEGGKRLTDLWLYGGKLLLGHKALGFIKEIKNNAERGLFSPLPHFQERRLLKALGSIFPGKTFRLYSDNTSLKKALNDAGFEETSFPKEIRFPEEFPLWRPMMDETSAKAILAKKVFYPILPCPIGPEILVINSELDSIFPEGDMIAPVILASCARSIFLLINSIKEGRPQNKKIDKALKNSNWVRKGIYLFIDMQKMQDKGKTYKEVFCDFLEGGFLLPPTPKEPAILPCLMSKGEEDKLAELLINP